MKTFEELKTELVALGFKMEHPRPLRKFDRYFSQSLSLEKQYEKLQPNSTSAIFYYRECVNFKPNGVNGQVFDEYDVDIKPLEIIL